MTRATETGAHGGTPARNAGVVPVGTPAENAGVTPGAIRTRSLPPVLLAWRFLLPVREPRYAEDAGWRTAGRWLVFWGLLIGVLYAAVFRVAWRWFGEYQNIRFVPIALVLAADLSWGGYRLLAALAGVAARPAVSADSRAGDSGDVLRAIFPALLVILLVVILKYAMLLSLPMGVTLPNRPTEWVGWRARLGPLYPQAIYRPLILMPLWGRWGMTLAMSIGRSAPDCSWRLARMAEGLRLGLIMVYWLICAALTMLYGSGSSGHVARGVVIAMGVMVVAYAVSFVLARRCGGQSEATVGATGVAAELAFLALYLPVASDIYWY